MLCKNRECWADFVLPASLTVNPANKGRPTNVALMLAHRLRRYYDASPTSKQHWSNVPCLLEKRRRHTGPDPVCVQEIGLHSLPVFSFNIRLVYTWPFISVHVLAPWRARLVGVWQLLSRFYHWKSRVKCQPVLHFWNHDRPRGLASKLCTDVKWSNFWNTHSNFTKFSG